MPIRELSAELVSDIVESYGQITKLNLSTNEIVRVENLERLTRLSNLDLFCNRLGAVPGSLDGLALLTRLKDLDISENSITSLQPLLSAPASLLRLNVANNSVAGVDQVSYLTPLSALTELVLAGNPLAAEDGYRGRTLHALSSLTALDDAPRDQHGYDHDEGAGEADGPPTPPVPASAPAGVSVRRTSFGSHPAGPTGHPPPSKFSHPPSRAADPAVSPAPLSDASDHDVAGASMSSLAVQQRGLDDVSGKSPSAEPDSALPVPGSGGWVPAGATGMAEPERESRQLEEQRGRGNMAKTGDPGEIAAGGVSAGRAGTGWVVPPPSSHLGGEGRGLLLQADARAVARTGMPVGATSAALALRQSGVGNREAIGGVCSDIGAENRSGHETAAVAPNEEPVAPPDAVHDGGGLPEFRPAVETAKAADRVLGRRQHETAVPDRDTIHLSEVESVAGDGPHARSDMMPDVSTSVQPPMGTHLPITESEARWGPPALSGDNRSSVDEGSRWTANGAPPPHPRFSGVGSSWESSLEGEHLLGVRYDYLVSAAGAGGTGNARTTGGDRSEIVSYGTALSGDGRQVLLAPEAAASTALGERGDFEGGHAARPADSGSGVVDRRAAFFREATGHDGQNRYDRHPSAQLPGAGFTARRGGPVVGLVGGPKQHGTRLVEDSLGLGREGEGVLKPPPRSAVPLKTGTWGEAPPEVPPRRQAGGHAGGKAAVGGEREVAVVDRGEWEALRRENEDLRRRVALSEKRCGALSEMQRLADDALAAAHPLPFSSPPADTTAPERPPPPRHEAADGVLSPPSSVEEGEERRRKRCATGEGGDEDGETASGGGGDGGGGQAAVARLLAAWRAEVLKLLLQRGVDAEVAAEESREARREVVEARDARARAEMEAKSLTQRALAAEAEAELSGIKLTRAFEELREERTGRCAAEASSAGYSVAVRDLHEWVQGFLGRASEGVFEREALLARGVAKLEAFSERLSQAHGRVQVLETLLRHKEIRLRNSRAALAADRRVWLLERRDRELAALSEEAARRPPPSAASSASRRKPHRPGGGAGGAWDSSSSSSRRTDAAGGESSGGVDGGDEAWGGGRKSAAVAATQPPLLEGLRPECEAVMRALFCRVDRLGTGAVRARRLLDVLRSDCGVSEVMEAAVGKSRWRAALDSMEATLCHPVADSCTPNGDGGLAVQRTTTTAAGGGNTRCSVERDVTWGEFLLFFLPPAGNADDAYNAGLISRFHGRSGCWGGFPDDHASVRDAGGASGGGGGGGRRPFGAVSEDAAAMLQMVVPAHWPAGGGHGGGGLAALSVGQLRREVLRLAKERAFLLALVREDGRLGKRRAEAVHDQYRHELRALHSKKGELERLVQEEASRNEEGQERARVVQQEACSLREELKKAEQEWKERVDAAVREKESALSESLREASQSATKARERISRLEAEHSLALRENGKSSVRQRALERELARIKSR
ncbi:unnamed protein product [Ectocarpus sp. 12 AP-2014]